MPWTSLPPELIDKVVSERHLRKRDLANLARVNRSTYPIVLKMLYREVKLHGSGERQDQEVLDLFHRTLTESPRLATFTQSLTINAFLPDDDKLLRSKTIIGKLYALQTLSLAFYGKGYFDESFVENVMPTDLDTGTDMLARVRDIEIIDPELTFSGISTLMCLPKVESLTVKCHRRNVKSGEAVLPSTTSHPSSLKNLSLTISADCNPGLQRTLPVCSALETFICNISSMHNVNDHPVSPAGLCRVLTTCQKTLVTMEFNSHKLGHIDDTMLDLSHFCNLKSLKASSLLLFGEDERDDPALRIGLYTRLPSSLEKLEILFASDTYVFKALDECDDEDPDESEATNTGIKDQNTVWLVEVAQHRRGLSYVRIEEEAGQSPSMRVHRTATLRGAPPQVKEAFDTANINIELYLRPPFYPAFC